MKIDAYGKPCPQPVVLALKALAGLPQGEILEIKVDNETAVENLKRMAEQKHCDTEIEKRSDGWQLSLRPREAAESDLRSETEDQRLIRELNCALPQSAETLHARIAANTVIAFGSAVMGQGDDRLGAQLMKGYIFALTQSEQLPKQLLFFNGGARLTTEGSESLADLQQLSERGVEILTCGTCLDFYGIKEKLCVGGVTNMYAISESLLSADKVIRL